MPMTRETVERVLREKGVTDPKVLNKALGDFYWNDIHPNLERGNAKMTPEQRLAIRDSNSAIRQEWGNLPKPAAAAPKPLTGAKGVAAAAQRTGPGQVATNILRLPVIQGEPGIWESIAGSMLDVPPALAATVGGGAAGAPLGPAGVIGGAAGANALYGGAVEAGRQNMMGEDRDLGRIALNATLFGATGPTGKMLTAGARKVAEKATGPVAAAASRLAEPVIRRRVQRPATPAAPPAPAALPPAATPAAPPAPAAPAPAATPPRAIEKLRAYLAARSPEQLQALATSHPHPTVRTVAAETLATRPAPPAPAAPAAPAVQVPVAAIERVPPAGAAAPDVPAASPMAAEGEVFGLDEAITTLKTEGKLDLLKALFAGGRSDAEIRLIAPEIQPQHVQAARTYLKAPPPLHPEYAGWQRGVTSHGGGIKGVDKMAPERPKPGQAAKATPQGPGAVAAPAPAPPSAQAIAERLSGMHPDLAFEEFKLLPPQLQGEIASILRLNFPALPAPAGPGNLPQAFQMPGEVAPLGTPLYGRRIPLPAQQGSFPTMPFPGGPTLNATREALGRQPLGGMMFGSPEARVAAARINEPVFGAPEPPAPAAWTDIVVPPEAPPPPIAAAPRPAAAAPPAPATGKKMPWSHPDNAANSTPEGLQATIDKVSGIIAKNPKVAKMYAPQLARLQERQRQMGAPGRPFEPAPVEPGAPEAPVPSQAPAGEAIEPPVGQSVLPEPPPAVEAPARPGELPEARVDAKDIHVDATTYQFKESINAEGETGVLAGTRKWDSLSGQASPVILHQRADGRYFVADGHQRVALAKRLQAQGQDVPPLKAIVLREADGYMAADARRMAALLNIRQGSGTTLDVAKVFRDGGLSADDIARLPVSGERIRQGQDLAKLSDDAFNYVAGGNVSENSARNAAAGASVGRHIADPDLQMAALKELKKAKPANAAEADEIVGQIAAEDFERRSQATLFGEETFAESLAPTMGKIVAAAQANLGRNRHALGNLLSNREIVETYGNLVEEAGTAAGREALGVAQHLLGVAAKTSGPAREALRAEAREVAGGTKNVAQAQRDLLKWVQDNAKAVRAEFGLSAERPGHSGPTRGDAAGSSAEAPLTARTGELEGQTTLLPDEQGATAPASLGGEREARAELQQGIWRTQGAIPGHQPQLGADSLFGETGQQSLLGRAQALLADEGGGAKVPDFIQKLFAPKAATGKAAGRAGTGGAEATAQPEFAGRSQAQADAAASAPPAPEPTGYKARPAREAREPLPEYEVAGRDVRAMLGRASSDEEIQSIVFETMKASEQRYVAARGGRTVSHAETRARAAELGVDDVLDRNKKLSWDEMAAALYKIEGLLNASSENIKATAQRVQVGEASTADLLKAFAAHDRVIVHALGAEAGTGRAMNILQATRGAREKAKNIAAIRDLVDSFGGEAHGQKLADLVLDADKYGGLGKAGKFARTTLGAKSWDVVLELWYNSILSGPPTHAANMAANAITAVAKVGETALAATIGVGRAGFAKIAGKEAPVDRVYFGEVAQQIRGIVKGGLEGVELFIKAMKTGETSGRFATTAEVPRETAIPGIGGRIIRSPSTGLMAEDEFFKSIGFRMNMGALAYRAAVKKGLTGKAVGRYVDAAISNPPPKLLDAAKDAAAYQTFTNSLQGGGILREIGRGQIAFRAKHPTWTFVVPFVRTLVNLTKYGQERSPLLLLDPEMRAAFKAGGTRQDIAWAKLMMGTGVAAATFNWAAEGRITGGGPSEPNARRTWLAAGNQPYSVKVGDRWYEYSRLAPWGTIMGVTADAVDIGSRISEADALEITSSLVRAFTKNITNLTMLAGIVGIVNTAADPDRYAPQYIMNLLAPVVPNIVAKGAQALDPSIRDVENVYDKILSRIPGMSSALRPKLTALGDEIKRDSSPFETFLFPGRIKSAQADPVYKEMLRLKLNRDVQHEDVTVRGQEVKLSPEQAQRITREAGQRAKERIGRLIQSGPYRFAANAPDGLKRQRDKIGRIIDQERRRARSAVIREIARAK